MIEFGKRLKELRKQRALTQAQLASRIHVTKAIISAYESETRYPSLEILIKLSDIFNVTTDYLLCLNKRHYIDITDMTPEQINILKEIARVFRN